MLLLTVNYFYDRKNNYCYGRKVFDRKSARLELTAIIEKFNGPSSIFGAFCLRYFSLENKKLKINFIYIFKILFSNERPRSAEPPTTHPFYTQFAVYTNC